LLKEKEEKQFGDASQSDEAARVGAVGWDGELASMTEPEHESRVVFPLRTNVALFKTPEGYLELEERLKVAALLYDNLLLEGGFYTFQATRIGSSDWHVPRAAISDEEAGRRRAEHERIDGENPHAEFYVALQTAGSDRVIPVVRGPIEASYFAEFQSLAAKFSGREQAWVEWLDGDIESASPAGEWKYDRCVARYSSLVTLRAFLLPTSTFPATFNCCVPIFTCMALGLSRRRTCVSISITFRYRR